MLRHLCYVSRHVRCFNTFVRYYTISYLWAPIMLCPSHSLLPVDTGKYLYVVYMNNMIYEIKSNQLCSIVYLRVPSITRFLLCTPSGDMKTLIYELCYMYTIIEDHYKWSYMLYIFPLSYKLSIGVSSV